MPNHNIVILNQIKNGHSETEVQARLEKALRITAQQAEQILRRKRTIIKKNVPTESIEKYEKVLTQCGIEFSIEPIDISLIPKEEVNVEKTMQIDEPSNKITEENPSLSTHMETQAFDVYSTPPSTSAKTAFCRECGAAMEKTQTQCDQCGATVTGTEGRSKIVAGFLAFFLGGFGVHRFYLGQWWGVFYIPFSLFFISGFVSFCEAIYFWACSKETWHNKYGHLGPSNVWVIVAICIIPFIAIVGILAAVALPAYQDYKHRAYTTEGFLELEKTAEQVGQFIIKTNFIPTSNIDAGMEDLSPLSASLTEINIIENAKIVGKYAPFNKNSEAYTLVLTPSIDSKRVTWTCKEGTMPDRYRPAKCRGGTTQAKITTENKRVFSSESNASLNIPNTWRLNVADNEDASINAGNIYKEGYIIVIEDPLTDLGGYTLESFADEMTHYYLNTFENASLLSNNRITSNSGDIGYSYEISATADGLDVHYITAYYFSEKRAYQLFSWSLTNQYKENKPVLQNIITSFQVGTEADTLND